MQTDTTKYAPQVFVGVVLFFAGLIFASPAFALSVSHSEDKPISIFRTQKRSIKIDIKAQPNTPIKIKPSTCLLKNGFQAVGVSVLAPSKSVVTDQKGEASFSLTLSALKEASFASGAVSVEFSAGVVRKTVIFEFEVVASRLKAPHEVDFGDVFIRAEALAEIELVLEGPSGFSGFLEWTELKSDKGAILSGFIEIGPKVFKLTPSGGTKINLKVRLPRGTRPGLYTGELHVACGAHSRKINMKLRAQNPFFESSEKEIVVSAAQKGSSFKKTFDVSMMGVAPERFDIGVSTPPIKKGASNATLEGLAITSSDTSPMIAPNQKREITIEYEIPPAQEDGLYEGEILCRGGAARFVLPIKIEILRDESERNFELEPIERTFSVGLKKSTSLAIQILSNRDEIQNVEYSFSNPNSAWWIDFKNTKKGKGELELPPRSELELAFDVMPPSEAKIGDSVTLTVTAQNKNKSTETSLITLKVAKLFTAAEVRKVDTGRAKLLVMVLLSAIIMMLGWARPVLRYGAMSFGAHMFILMMGYGVTLVTISSPPIPAAEATEIQIMQVDEAYGEAPMAVRRFLENTSPDAQDIEEALADNYSGGNILSSSFASGSSSPPLPSSPLNKDANSKELAQSIATAEDSATELPFDASTPPPPGEAKVASVLDRSSMGFMQRGPVGELSLEQTGSLKRAAAQSEVGALGGIEPTVQMRQQPKMDIDELNQRAIPPAKLVQNKASALGPSVPKRATGSVRDFGIKRGKVKVGGPEIKDVRIGQGAKRSSFVVRSEEMLKDIPAQRIDAAKERVDLAERSASKSEKPRAQTRPVERARGDNLKRRVISPEVTVRPDKPKIDVQFKAKRFARAKVEPTKNTLQLPNTVDAPQEEQSLEELPPSDEKVSEKKQPEAPVGRQLISRTSGQSVAGVLGRKPGAMPTAYKSKSSTLRRVTLSRASSLGRATATGTSTHGAMRNGRIRTSRAETEIGILRHAGGWSATPRAMAILAKQMPARMPGLSMEVSAVPVGASESALMNSSMLFITGNSDPKLSNVAVTRLKEFIKNKGFIWIDDGGSVGNESFHRAVRKLLPRLVPGGVTRRVGVTHSIFSCAYDLGRGYLGRTVPVGAYDRTRELDGVFDIRGRLVAVYTRNGYARAIEYSPLAAPTFRPPGARTPRESREGAFRIATNIMTWSLISSGEEITEGTARTDFDPTRRYRSRGKGLSVIDKLFNSGWKPIKGGGLAELKSEQKPNASSLVVEVLPSGTNWVGAYGPAPSSLQSARAVVFDVDVKARGVLVSLRLRTKGGDAYESVPLYLRRGKNTMLRIPLDGTDFRSTKTGLKEHDSGIDRSTGIATMSFVLHGEDMGGVYTISNVSVEGW